jgi:transcription elongation factor GreA
VYYKLEGRTKMAEEKEIILTKEGLENLEQELEQLKTVRRKEVTEKIKEALSFGDLSENAEYDEARNEQAEVESRINQIESMLKFARVIDENDIQADIVSLGSHVKILDIEFDEELEYTIVGPTEVDPNSKLSYESPVGAALMNHTIGDVVEAVTPGGTAQFKILDITR